MNTIILTSHRKGNDLVITATVPGLKRPVEYVKRKCRGLPFDERNRIERYLKKNYLIVTDDMTMISIAHEQRIADFIEAVVEHRKRNYRIEDHSKTRFRGNSFGIAPRTCKYVYTKQLAVADVLELGLTRACRNSCAKEF